VDDDGHQSTYLTKQKLRGKKEKKTMFISFGGSSWNVSYFNCCWFELAIRRRGQELYDLC
jgi:hypothetical protein